MDSIIKQYLFPHQLKEASCLFNLNKTKDNDMLAKQGDINVMVAENRNQKPELKDLWAYVAKEYNFVILLINDGNRQDEIFAYEKTEKEAKEKIESLHRVNPNCTFHYESRFQNLTKDDWKPLELAPFSIDILIKLETGKISVDFRTQTEFRPSNVKSTYESFVIFAGKPVGWKEIPDDF